MLGLGCLPLAAQPLAWTGRVGVATDWLLRGVRLSDGHAPLTFAGIDAYAGNASFGATAMHLHAQGGLPSDAWTLHGGFEWRPAPALALVADLQHKRYSGPLAAWNGHQLSLGVAVGDRASITWNRQRLREPALDADSLDAAARWPVAPGLQLAGGLGYAWHALGAPYVYGQAGLEWQPGAARLQLQRVWTHGAGPALDRASTAPRWVGGASWTF